MSRRKNTSAKPKDDYLASLPVPGRNEVVFCALGGIGEIGMNAALYGHDGKWIMVDCGITFADDQNPGVDVIVPDMTAAQALGENLLGVVITHAHEDHVGGVPYVGPGLGAPVYATPFTTAFLRRKLQDDGFGEVDVRKIDAGGEFKLGPFDLRYLPVPHSVPEAQSLSIATGVGTLLHTGDWKTDPEPVVGKGFREERFRKLGDAGVLAMFCDSTNATVDGVTQSEASLAPGIGSVIANAPGRVAFTCFSSNVARMITIARAAAEQGKHVGLVGRSLKRMHDIASGVGYWPDDLPGFVEEDHIGYLPPEQTVIICTGSQGEAQAALARMAGGSHQHVTLNAGDTVAYSSRDIPGNERSIGRIRNRLIEAGVHIVREEDEHIHVSGHPARDELRRMYQLVRPKLLVPCHGETAHLAANEALAKDEGIPAVAQAPNGTVLRIRKGEATAVGNIRTGRRAVDGRRMVAIGGVALRSRQQVLHNGAVVVSAAVDRDGDLAADLEISVHGLTDEEDEELLDDIAEAVEDTLASAPGRDHDGQVEKVRRAVRSLCRARFNKRPVVTVHLLRVDTTLVN